MRNSSTLSKKILNELENAGQNVRKYYQLRLPNNPKKDYYFMLRDTANNESIIVEYGFIDSKSDSSQIINNYEKYAEAVVKAVCEYKDIKYIPPKSSDDYYVVKNGDNLWDIARKYNTSVSELKKFNNLKSDTLKIGQYLKIPKNASNNSNSSVINSNYINYKVINGDSLSKIASKYGISVSKLKDYNNLNSDNLKINQTLKIPGKFINYSIKSGDNLWDIARKYNTTVDRIKKINNLSTNTLQIGKTIIIKNE